MSWFGGGGKSAKTPSSAESRRGANALFGAGGGSADDDNESFDVGSLENDAGLLSELEGLRSSMGLSDPTPPAAAASRLPHPPSAASRSAAAPRPPSPARPTQRAAPGPAPSVAQLQPGEPVDLDSILADVPAISADAVEDDVEVEFTDADMEDPELLRELARVGGGERGGGGGGSETADRADDGVQEVGQRASSSPSSSSSKIPTRQDIYDPTRQESIMPSGPAATPQSSAVPATPPPFDPSTHPQSVLALTRITEYKQAALRAKRAGDVKLAREHLAAAKGVQELVERAGRLGGWDEVGMKVPGPPAALQAGLEGSAVGATGRGTPGAPVAANQTGNGAKTTTVAKAAGASTPVKQPSASKPPTQAAAKSQPSARPPIASTPLADTTTDSISSLILRDLPPITFTTPSDVFHHIQTQLTAQSALCLQIAAHHLKHNRKPLALEFHRRRKAFQADAVVVAAAFANPQPQAPPAFRYEELEFETERRFDDVGLDELEVRVVRGFDLGLTGSIPSRDLSLSVAFDLGWPPVDPGQPPSASGTGATPPVSGDPSPVFDFSKRLRIDRGARGFQRHVERKRVWFDVVHRPRCGWLGVFGGSREVCLGRGGVRMEELLRRCEVHEVVELMDKTNPRKSTGGKLEVALRLRTPLLKPEIVRTREKWLVLDAGASSGSLRPAVPSAAAPQQSQTAPVVAGESAVATSSAGEGVAVAAADEHANTKPATIDPSAPGKATPTTTAAQPASGSATAADRVDIDELEIQFFTPETIVSNMVLESEHAALTKQIASLQAARKPVPEDLTDRKLGYELRMNLLVTMVQVGSLTMDDYIASVKRSIAATKKQALTFKSHGRTELARQALVRVKVMTEEVEEVEAAMAAGEGEGGEGEGEGDE